MKKLVTLQSILLILFLVSCSSGEGEPEQRVNNGYPNPELLVSSAELNDQLDDETLLLIDARAEQPDSLIPGAVWFAAVPELSDPDHEVDNYLVGPVAFQQKMRAIGLDAGDNVIIYDGGNNLVAARLFYALENYGFSNAALLNGGFAAWTANGYPIATSPAEPEAGSFTIADEHQNVYCDFSYVTAASEDPDKIIFDVRSPEEYTGEVVRSEKGGHIPNAVNLEWRNVLEDEGVPYFLPADEIASQYEELGITPDKEVIPHCQSNVRGAHAYFTLRLMGYDSVRPYEGSWAEYGNREDSVVQ